MSFDYSQMGIQKGSLDCSEETSFTAEGSDIQQPRRLSRCNCPREKHTQIFKYLIWILISSWYLLSLISLFKTGYVQERHLCPYSELWTYLVVSLIIDSTIIISVSKKIQAQEELIFPYLPIVSLWKLGLKYLGFSIWGTLIFYSFSCTKNLDDTLLFWVSLYHYLINIILVGILGLITLKVMVFPDELSEITDEQIEEFAHQLRRSENSDGSRNYSLEV